MVWINKAGLSTRTKQWRKQDIANECSSNYTAFFVVLSLLQSLFLFKIVCFLVLRIEI